MAKASAELSNRTPQQRGRAADVAKVLRARIESRQLEPGDRLPSFVQLRTEFGIAMNTSNRVYSLLADEGYADRRSGSGVYVSVPQRVRTGFVGFAMSSRPDLRYHSYWMSLIEGARGFAGKSGRSLVLIGTENRDADVMRVDGYVDAAFNDGGAVGSDSPSVIVLGDDGVRSAVIADEADGIKQVVQHLLFLGHRKIAYLHGNAMGERVAAFRDAMGEAGITVPSSWLRRLPNLDANGRQVHRFDEKAVTEMRRWLAQDWAELGCTALLCQNDDAAIGAMKVFREAGFSVPGDVSVVGFDGVESSRVCSPALTTVEMPLARIAERAMEILIAKIERHDTELAGPRVECLPVRIHIRASTGPVPAPR